MNEYINDVVIIIKIIVIMFSSLGHITNLINYHTQNIYLVEYLKKGSFYTNLIICQQSLKFRYNMRNVAKYIGTVNTDI